MVDEKVREGYKSTEVGVIPSEWNSLRVEDCVSIKTGSKNTQDKIDEGIYPFFVRSQQVEKINSYSYDCEAVLTAGDGVGTGKVFHYINGKFDAHQRVYIMTNFKDITGKYFYYYFSNYFYDEVIKYTAKTSVDSVRRDMIAKMLLPIPTLNEQKSITESIEEIDNLLQSLETLIDKKKKIKQGTMQQLLTGKKRLPGFSDEWEVKKLIELGYFVSGNGFPIIYQELNEGEFPFYKVSDFNNIGNEIYMIRANNYIDEQIREKLSAKIIPKNSIIFAKIGAAIFLERKRISSVKCCIDNNMMSYICDVNYLYEKFAYYLYNSIKLSSLVSATALPSLSAKDIGELKINIPINIDEQKAIANILTVMDSEIATLQQKLEKYKRIKQGMMQELLTGRIRLI